MKRLCILLTLTLFIVTIFITLNPPRFDEQKTNLVLRISEIAEKIALPYRIARLAAMDRDTSLVVPLQNVPLRAITDSWGMSRPDERVHEGVDVFAKKGTPVFSATDGYVIRTGTNALGGNIVFVIGAGGVRYYYAHLDSVAKGIAVGQEVTTDTVIGYVGNTGNAESTPPHLHFGMYKNGAENPYELLVPRI